MEALCLRAEGIYERRKALRLEIARYWTSDLDGDDMKDFPVWLSVLSWATMNSMRSLLKRSCELMKTTGIAVCQSSFLANRKIYTESNGTLTVVPLDIGDTKKMEVQGMALFSLLLEVMCVLDYEDMNRFLKTAEGNVKQPPWRFADRFDIPIQLLSMDSKKVEIEGCDIIGIFDTLKKIGEWPVDDEDFAVIVELFSTLKEVCDILACDVLSTETKITVRSFCFKYKYPLHLGKELEPNLIPRVAIAKNPHSTTYTTFESYAESANAHMLFKRSTPEKQIQFTQYMAKIQKYTDKRGDPIMCMNGPMQSNLLLSETEDCNCDACKATFGPRELESQPVEARDYPKPKVCQMESEHDGMEPMTRGEMVKYLEDTMSRSCITAKEHKEGLAIMSTLSRAYPCAETNAIAAKWCAMVTQTLAANEKTRDERMDTAHATAKETASQNAALTRELEAVRIEHTLVCASSKSDAKTIADLRVTSQNDAKKIADLQLQLDAACHERDGLQTRFTALEVDTGEKLSGALQERDKALLDRKEALWNLDDTVGKHTKLLKTLQQRVKEMRALKLNVSTLEIELARVKGQMEPTTVAGALKMVEVFQNKATSLNQKQLEEAEKLNQKQLEEAEKLKDALKLEEDSKLCVVCLSEPRNCIIMPCAHLCVCAVCCAQLDFCPICREPKDHRIAVFTS